jgi:hypothetical protein
MADDQDCAWFFQDALTEESIQTLPPALFKAWFNLSVVAIRNDGRGLPSFRQAAFETRTTPAAVKRQVEALIKARAFYRDENGVILPAGWQSRLQPQTVERPALRLVGQEGRQ